MGENKNIRNHQLESKRGSFGFQDVPATPLLKIHPPKMNECPQNRDHFKRKRIIFQAAIFQGTFFEGFQHVFNQNHFEALQSQPFFFGTKSCRTGVVKMGCMDLAKVV